MRTNVEDRDEAIELIGVDEFYSVKENEQYRSLPIPIFFTRLFSIFIEIENLKGESLTWNILESYCKIRNVKLTQYEIELIIKMNSWASEERNALQNTTVRKKDDDAEAEE